MSFLKKLFGGGGDSGAESSGPVGEPVQHNGYTILATPFSEEGQYQTCGVISKEIGGEVREHRFIRADRFPGIEDAAAHSIRKGIQLVDEQGEAIFRR